MDGNNRYKTVAFNNIYNRRMLNSHLITPSLEFSYSMCIEYMKEWFLKRFNKDYFGKDYAYVFVDDSHIFGEYKKLNNEELLFKGGPEQGKLSIVPTIDDSFNREGIEDAMYGVDMMIRRSRYEDSFFKDRANDRFISSTLTLISMEFTYKVQVETLPQQLDLFRRMKQTFRVGYTQGEYISMDYILPTELVLNVAHDAGFEIKDHDVVDPIKFLSYMNSHSQLPILYKHRCVNGHNEYFVRMDNMYVWLNASEISRDQGERVGHLKTNYNIEMRASVRFPTAQYYVYHTSEAKLIPEYTGESFVSEAFRPIYSIRQFVEKPVNDKGWNSYLISDYEDEVDKPLTIEFEEFFAGTEIEKLIKHSLSIHVNPELFIDIHVYNDLKRVPMHMDWNTLIMTSKDPVDVSTSHIVIYMDLEYVNGHRVDLDNIMENKFSKQ